jgi:RimJ/RimL family protein N-acetyltransferase
VKYFPKIPGTKVFLSPISLEDAERYAQWLNDLETTRYLSLASAQISVHGEREALVGLAKGHNYAIVEAGTQELVGNCGLMDLEEASRTAEIGIFIGPAAARGRGYGTEALRLLSDYAFNVLNLRSLMLRVYDYNGRGQASYRKVGFKEIGRRRKAHFYGGEYHDVVFMDLLAEELGPSSLPPPS